MKFYQVIYTLFQYDFKNVAKELHQKGSHFLSTSEI